jgi:A/G-specific adenine glycosylase
VIDRRALLAWAGREGRDLPWRRTRDPWAVLVSEVMLQQTQVGRVVPCWERFMARFPTVAACAAAGAGEVVRAWSGLGYNRRAVALHAAAAATVDRHGGDLPADLDALLALPGVGPYTARAVLAFAFEADAAVVDVNAARVLARSAGRPLGRAEAQRLADGLVPRGRAWAWNSAVLDLGATVCRRRQPRCGLCPVAGTCAWAAAGHPGPDPAGPTTPVPARAFAGSDREGRGRLVAALRRGPVARARAAAACGWPSDPERAARVVEDLVAEGLAVVEGSRLALP